VLQRRLGLAVPCRADALATARFRRRAVARFVDGRVGVPERGPLVTLRQLFVMAAMCDNPSAVGRFVRLHVARMARRRARRWVPALVPVEWEA
jgi:hypothetical protein